MDIQAELKKLTPKERAALAVKLDVHERTILRWADGETPIKSIYVPALEAALRGKR